MGFSEWTWELFEHRHSVRQLYLKYHPDKQPHGNVEAFRFLKNAVTQLEKWKTAKWPDIIKDVEELRSVVDLDYESKFGNLRSATTHGATASFDFDRWFANVASRNNKRKSARPAAVPKKTTCPQPTPKKHKSQDSKSKTATCLSCHKDFYVARGAIVCPCRMPAILVQ